MLARCANQVESDFMKIVREFLGFRLFADFVAQHPHISAKRSRADRILSFAASDAEQLRRVADGESQHANSDFLRHREVARLMDDHQDAEDQHCTQNRPYHLRSSGEGLRTVTSIEMRLPKSRITITNSKRIPAGRPANKSDRAGPRVPERPNSNLCLRRRASKPIRPDRQAVRARRQL